MNENHIINITIHCIISFIIHCIIFHDIRWYDMMLFLHQSMIMIWNNIWFQLLYIARWGVHKRLNICGGRCKVTVCSQKNEKNCMLTVRGCMMVKRMLPMLLSWPWVRNVVALCLVLNTCGLDPRALVQHFPICTGWLAQWCRRLQKKIKWCCFFVARFVCWGKKEQCVFPKWSLAILPKVPWTNLHIFCKLHGTCASTHSLHGFAKPHVQLWTSTSSAPSLLQPWV